MFLIFPVISLVDTSLLSDLHRINKFKTIQRDVLPRTRFRENPGQTYEKEETRKVRIEFWNQTTQHERTTMPLDVVCIHEMHNLSAKSRTHLLWPSISCYPLSLSSQIQKKQKP